MNILLILKEKFWVGSLLRNDKTYGLLLGADFKKKFRIILQNMFEIFFGEMKVSKKKFEKKIEKKIEKKF